MGDRVDQLGVGDIETVESAIRKLAEDFSRTHPGGARPFGVEFDHWAEVGPKRVHVPASEVIGALAALREGHREPFDALQGRFGNLDFLVDVVLPFAATHEPSLESVTALMSRIVPWSAPLRSAVQRFSPTAAAVLAAQSPATGTTAPRRRSNRAFFPDSPVSAASPAPSPPPVATVSAGFNVQPTQRPGSDREESSRIDLTPPDYRERGPTPRGDTVQKPGLRERLIIRAYEADLSKVAEILTAMDDSQIKRLSKGLRHWRAALRRRGHGEIAKALPAEVSRTDQLLLMVAAISAREDFGKIVSRLLPSGAPGLPSGAMPTLAVPALPAGSGATVLIRR